MKAQDALRLIAIQQLKRQLSQGQITAQELTRRLSRAIDDEMLKGPARMDSAFIKACEDLLYELNAPASKQLPEAQRDNWRMLYEKLSRRKPQPLLLPRLRRAAVALSLVLLVGSGLWLVRQRPPTELKHLSTTVQGGSLPSPDLSLSPVPVTALPFESATMAPIETPNPTPTPTQLPTPGLTTEPVPPPPTPEPLPSGREKYLSLAELRKTAPARWTASYELNSRTVQVDVPIKLPEADKLPLFELKWMPLKVDELREKVLSAYPRVHSFRTEARGQIDLIVAEGSRSYLEGPSGLYGEPSLAEDQPAQNSSFPKDAPMPFLTKLLEQLGVQAGPISKDVQLGASGLYPLISNSQPGGPGEPFINHLNFDAPIKGFETGTYRLSAVQMVGGLPLFPGQHHYAGPGSLLRLDPHINLRIRDEKEFRLRARLLSVEKQRESDLPILSPDLVIRSVENLIRQGFVRRVDSMELGYMLFQAQHLRTGEKEEDALLLAVPVWRVRGVRLDPGEVELNGAHSRHYLETLGDPIQQAMFDLRFNAQTGEYLDPDQPLPTRINPAVLTFAQLDSEEEDLRLF